ncbi:hypothetical protein FX988_02072 [Paraglaciecola mesophila]|uniref:Uncharacterized protein n=1 Tax=Paraglaciecola mesophila TaxID=197222 RepID=A0A857JJT3_9ALTE|nr:hypothetical protein [Paraglaciecola mesophila]QHJ11836.1 hypothetical protein FX988_02072 [Paraglaciecola mesophila]
MARKITSSDILVPLLLISLMNVAACTSFSKGSEKGSDAPLSSGESNSSHQQGGSSHPIKTLQKTKVTNHPHPLSWVQGADPLSDARQAIKANDLRFLAFAGRAIAIPGVNLAEYPIEYLEQHCGYRTLKGTGDTLRVGEQTSLRSLAHDYAIVYNQTILASCL